MSDHSVNLITAYIEAAGETPANALRALNGELGGSYDATRLGQWRRGERPIPDKVQRVMRRWVLEAHLGMAKAGELAPMLEAAYRLDFELECTASAGAVTSKRIIG